ncbi:MAG: monomethylamine:corrinoid methyltransferase [Deltaproteobacteria bacterium]|nr:monomethylamine:corrinoid methyltransferase [Deltaproteobacteria bacterium]
MISFYEVLDRAMMGEYRSEKEFDMNVFVPKLNELVSKYNIKYDPNNPISADDALADRVFQAGFELYRDVGSYCPDTERIIRFTDEELQAALNEAPAATVLGEGRDSRTLKARKPESDDKPFCYIGACGNAVSNEEIYASIMEAFASYLPLADAITAPSLATLNGRTVRTGTPLEVLASIRATAMGHEALTRGGRPGLAILNNIASAGSDTAKIAGSQFGVRNSDTLTIGPTAELKISFQRFNEIAYALTRGIPILIDSAPILGGYCGGPEGVAVTNVAYHLLSIIAMRGNMHLTFPIHFNFGCTSTRDVTWATSVSTQAMSRNSHFPFFILSYAAAGPMTEMCYYEIAETVTTSVVSGTSAIECIGVSKATTIDNFTPMESRTCAEVAHAVAGMTRKDANQIVLKLLEKYENYLDKPPIGKKYQECWDIAKKTPNADYAAFDKKMKKELKNMGIPF